MAHHRIRTGSSITQYAVLMERDFVDGTQAHITGPLPVVEPVTVSQFDGIDPADLQVPGVYLGKGDTGRHHQGDTLDDVETQTFAFYRVGRNEILFSGLSNPADPHHEQSRVYPVGDHSDKERRVLVAAR